MVEWKGQFLEMLEFSITGKVNGSRLCYIATNGRHILFIFWIYLLYLLLKNQTDSTEVKLLVYYLNMMKFLFWITSLHLKSSHAV